MINSLLLSTSLLSAQLLYNSIVKSQHHPLVTISLLSIGIANLLIDNIEVRYRDGRKAAQLYSMIFGFFDSVILLLGFNLLYKASLLFNLLYSFIVVNIIFGKIEKPFLFCNSFILFSLFAISSTLFTVDRDSSKMFFSVDYNSISFYNFFNDTTHSLHPFIASFLIIRRVFIGVIKRRTLAEIYIRPDCLHYKNEEEKKIIIPSSLDNFEFHSVTPYFTRKYYSIGYIISGLLYLLTDNTPLIFTDYKLYLYIICTVICTFAIKKYRFNNFILIYTLQISLLLLILSIFIHNKIGITILRLSTFELFTSKLYLFILSIFIINLIVFYFRNRINKVIVNIFI